MEEDKIQNEEETQMISEELKQEIADQVTVLRTNDPKLKMIFPIVVFGGEYDDKEMYVGYFRQPSFAAFSKYLSAAQSNQAVAMRTLAKDCFLGGDKELVEDDSLFLFGLMAQLSRIIEIRQAKLVNLSRPGK